MKRKTHADYQDDPEFQRLQEHVHSALDDLDNALEQLQEKFPLKDGGKWTPSRGRSVIAMFPEQPKRASWDYEED